MWRVSARRPIPLVSAARADADQDWFGRALAVLSTNVDTNIIVAGVVLWRVFYSLITIIPGSVTLSLFSKRNRDLLDQGMGAMRTGRDDPRSETVG
jgi:hypothetical protein